MPHVYVLHPPGGLVGGDRLETHISVREGASALFTTPAAQKLYRSDATTEQLTELRVQATGALEWFPAETIVFDGAHAGARTRVLLEPDSAFLGWDILCFGRTASALPFSRGELRWAFEIVRAGSLLSVDRIHVRGGSPVLSGAWGYGGSPVFGTLYCVPKDASTAAEALVALNQAAPQNDLAVTVVDGCCIVRSAGASVEIVRRALERCWALLRPLVRGRTAVPPRIWAV